MKEQLISFKTAKLAQKKGFPVDIAINAYKKDKKLTLNPPFIGHSWVDEQSILLHKKQIEKYKHLIAAPTQALLQKWLREEHNIEVWVTPIVGDYKVQWINKVNHNLYTRFVNKTYEEALEIGLYKALKLI